MPQKDIRLTPRPDRPTRLGFLLADDFSLMSWASVSEPFRAANILSGKLLYEWKVVAVGPKRAALASNRVRIGADCVIGDELSFDVVFVCVSGEATKFNDRTTLAWLRALARRGVTLAGVSGGSYVLARAGVLSGYRSTIHWEHMPAFIERFPTLDVVQELFVIDRGRMSCAGGTAGLDLALEMIAQDHGAKLAAMVSDWYIRTEAREGARSQRMSLVARYGLANPRVLRALSVMETNLAQVAPRARLAALAGVSPRQLDRLFETHMRQTVSEAYLGIRLERARRLIKESAMSIADVAAATGFSDAAHFSRRFSGRFGASPRALRTSRAHAKARR